MIRKNSRFKKVFFIIFLIFVLLLITISFLKASYNNTTSPGASYWQFQSIDTMKYSRDLARERLNDPSFNAIIEQQVKQIADTGATHIAIGTPYDDEFHPILQQWVRSARRNNLNVWFRGNWSGWEGWFDYPKITREEHIQKTKNFILQNPSLFKDGDVFSACPECENGGPGDPRITGDVEGHRQFLIDEYNVSKQAFQKIKKDIATNYNSMNGDVARLIMDRETTKALGGLVVVDHYVNTPEKLVADIREYAELSGGKVVLGEFGAPIPDIHGELNEEEQAAWIKKALELLTQTENLVGMNYWTSVGSSTALWDEDGVPHKAVEKLKSIYKPTFIRINVQNELGQSIKNVTLTAGEKAVHSESGQFVTVYLDETVHATISAEGYLSNKTVINGQNVTIVLKKEKESIFFKIQKILNNIFQPPQG